MITILFTYLIGLYNIHNSYGYILSNIKWNNGVYPYDVYLTEYSYINMIPDIEQASDEWNTIPYNDLKFVRSGIYITSNCDLPNLKQRVVKQGKSIVCIGHQISVTNLVYIPGSTQVIGFVIRIDPDYGKHWNVLLHEFGHVNGLDHSNIPDSIMGAHGDIKIDLQLVRDDIMGVHARLLHTYPEFNMFINDMNKIDHLYPLTQQDTRLCWCH